MRHDPRFLANSVWGSLGRGDGDEWSDVDLVVVVADDSVRSVLTSLRDPASAFGDAAIVLDMPQNGVAGGAFVSVTYVESGLPLHVDWYVCPQSRPWPGNEPDESFASFLDRNRSDDSNTPPRSEAILSMIPIAAKYVVRRSPQAPAVLALAGVDAPDSLDSERALTALRQVLAGLSESAGVKTSSAINALLDLAARQLASRT
ncbi:MAG: nucleotidyltransferase domain-containing protein [Acidimicrobiales bacterium]